MTTILLAEDHQIVRQGFRMLLQAEPSFEVVAETGDGLEAVQLAAELQPDVLVLDLSLPSLDGLEVARQVKAQAPKTQIVVLSMHNHEPYVVEALRSGAVAYVLKDSSVEDLVQAVHAALRGDRFFSPGLPTGLETAAPDAAPLADRYETLTTREREILHLLAEGYSAPEIAGKLFISPRTVTTHRTNLMAKLGLHSQTEVVHYALQRGLITLGRQTGDEDV